MLTLNLGIFYKRVNLCAYLEPDQRHKLDNCSDHHCGVQVLSAVNCQEIASPLHKTHLSVHGEEFCVTLPY